MLNLYIQLLNNAENYFLTYYSKYWNSDVDVINETHWSYLLFLLLGLFAFSCNVLLTVIIKLCVLLGFHHLLLSAVVFLGQLSRA